MHAPETYEKFKSIAQQTLVACMTPVFSNMRPWNTSEVVMDYGCGSGSNTVGFLETYLERTNSNVDAVDCSKEMLKSALEINPNQRVHYCVGNILDANWMPPRKLYDRIFGMHVMHYIKDFGTALGHFHQLLKVGGQVGLSFMLKSSHINIMRDLAADPILEPFMKGLDGFIATFLDESTPEGALENFLDVARNQGFKIVFSQQHRTQTDTTTTSVDTLAELVLALNPFVRCVPEDLQDYLKKRNREQTEKYGVPDENDQILQTTAYSASVVLEKIIE